MRELLAWEKNWLLQNGWTSERLEALAQSQDLTPVEYLTGRARFAGLTLYVDQRVLIPRIETETLVAMITEACKRRPTLESLIEVGTGSGAIAIALARACPQLQVLATDISEGALSVARVNVHHYDLDDRVQLLQADLLTHPQLPPRGDYFLVANLPYIPTQDYQLLDVSVREHEPWSALDGGSDGFVVIGRLLDQVIQLKHLPTMIFLEVDPSHTITTVNNYSQFQWQRYEDEFGRGRFLVGTRAINK